ncbi:MAG: phosphodiester glycosidase family protein [Synergistaceae bacterium]|jgi:hypothetical protein|nr:phosphodiester glycosidase family protein [Synergistaceae bacterium]
MQTKISARFFAPFRIVIALILILFPQSGAFAVTRAELLDSLFSELRYMALEKPPLPEDVPPNHRFANTVGSAMKYGLIPRRPFSPDDTVNRREAVRLALMMMGWGFEASLYESFEDLPDLGGSGDPIFFLAAEMNPSAPKGLLLDGETPLSGSGRDSLLSWARNCRKSVRWNRVLSFGGVDLVIYRQGAALPGAPNEPRGGNPIGAPLCEPLYVVALAVHPDLADARIAFAEPLGRGRAALTEISSAYEAIGAINGGFFSESRPIGTMLLEGTHAGKPVQGRFAVGWNNGEDGSLVFGDGGARIGVRTRSGYVPFTKFNVAPPPDEASLYTPDVAQSAPGVALDAIEIVVRSGVVVEHREARASDHRVPVDGLLIIGRGKSRALLEELAPGSSVKVITDWLTPAFDACANLIQAGPMLMRDEKFVDFSEPFQKSFLEKRHPRTIMGTDGKRIFWVVIDGRNSIHSRGTTIEETKWVAKSLGLKSAINLDGGGSSELIWRGIVANWPSDGKERPLPYALLMTPKGSKLVRKNSIQFGGFGNLDQGEFGEWGPAAGDPEREAIMMDTYNPLQDPAMR